MWSGATRALRPWPACVGACEHLIKRAAGRACLCVCVCVRVFVFVRVFEADLRPPAGWGPLGRP